MTNNSGALQALSLLANSDDLVLSHLNGLSMVCPFTGFENPDEAQRQVALFRGISFFK